MFDAESEFDTLTVGIADAEAELAVIEAEAAEMRSGLQDGAVYSFVDGGSGSFPFLIDLDARRTDGSIFGNADFDASTLVTFPVGATAEILNVTAHAG